MPRPCGADLLRSRRRFPHDVEFAMQRQYQRRVLRDAQIVGRDRNPLLGQPPDLVTSAQGSMTTPLPMTDIYPAARRQTAAASSLNVLPADDERMPGVVPALKTHDDVGALREPVHDLALALVAPLGSDHDDVRHLR